jgi:hypothetical protein
MKAGVERDDPKRDGGCGRPPTDLESVRRVDGWRPFIPGRAVLILAVLVGATLLEFAIKGTTVGFGGQ